MSNPARQLHSIYLSWQTKLVEKPSGSPRSLLAPTGGGFDEAILVAALLVRMRRLIDQMAEEGRPVDLYRRQIPSWFAPLASTNLSAAGGRGLIDAGLLDQIEGFANFLDDKVPMISADKQDNLYDLVAQALAVLEDDESLPRELSGYIRRLLQQIRVALESSRAGSAVDVGELAYSLWVAFAAAEARSKDNGNRWRDLGVQLLAGTVSGTIVQSGATILGALTT